MFRKIRARLLSDDSIIEVDPNELQDHPDLTPKHDEEMVVDFNNLIRVRAGADRQLESPCLALDDSLCDRKCELERRCHTQKGWSRWGHLITVSGLTTTRTDFQSAQDLDKITQSWRNAGVVLGLGRLPATT